MPAESLRCLLGRSSALVSVVLLASLSADLSASSTPGIVSGSVTFAQSGNKLTVTEKSPSAILNWQNFSVAAGEVVQFIQPSAGARILNRVTGPAASLISGTVEANGQFMLLNPNGITIAPGGRLNAASLLLTSSALADADFLAGRYNFTALPGQGGILNQGQISAAPGGQVILAAPVIDNQGVISAPEGSVDLVTAGRFIVDPTGDGLWRYQVDSAAAQGKGMAGISAAAINVSGMIEARGVTAKGGEIILDGGGGSVTLAPTARLDVSAGVSGTGGQISINSADTKVAGNLLAKGGSAGGDGGVIETSGHHLTIGPLRVETGAAKGKGGQWLLDPTDLTVDAAAAASIASALGSGDVTLTTTDSDVNGSSGPGVANPGGNGDITIASPIAWSSNQALVLNAYGSNIIKAPVTGSAAGSSLRLTSGQDSLLNAPVTVGSLTVNAGGGLTVAGAVTGSGATSSVALTSLAGDITLNAPITGVTLTANSAGAITLNGGASLSGLSLTSGGQIALNSPVSDSGDLTIRNGSDSDLNPESFGMGASLLLTGANPSVSLCNGVGCTPASYTVLRTANDVQGLSNFSGNYVLAHDIDLSSIQNFQPLGWVDQNNNSSPTIFTGVFDGFGHKLDHLTINSTGNNAGLFSDSAGVIANLGVTNAAVTSSGHNGIGIFAGLNSGQVFNSYSTGSVASQGSSGGLVGISALIQNLGNLGAGIVNSLSTATVSGAVNSGGLVGHILSGAIINSYATGLVSSDGSAGGLVGGLDGMNPYIFGSYAQGDVRGGVIAGGLVGLIQAVPGAVPRLANCYSTGQVSGPTAGGLVGRNDPGRLGTVGQITNSYFDSSRAGTTAGVGSGSGSGITGLATADLQAQQIDGFSNNSPGRYPLLNNFVYNLVVPVAAASQLYGSAAPSVSIGPITGFFGADTAALVSGLTVPAVTDRTSPVGSYIIAASGGSAVSSTGYPYSFTMPNSSLSVTPLPITLAAPGGFSKLYGTNGATLDGPSIRATQGGFVNGDHITQASMPSPAADPLGTTNNLANWTVTGSGLGNYTISYAPTSLTINKAILNITADKQTVTYGSGLPPLTYGVSGWVGNDSLSSLSSLPSLSTTASAQPGVGSYNITAAGASAPAYYDIHYNTGTLTVTRAPLTVSTLNGGFVTTYGSPSATLGADSIGIVAGKLGYQDAITGATVDVANRATVGGIAGGSLKWTVNGFNQSNYTITYVSTTLNINPAPLTLAAPTGFSKSYGSVDATLAGSALSVSGGQLFYGDRIDSATMPSSATDPAGTASGLGNWKASGDRLINYTISYQPTSLTITPAPLTLAAPASGFSKSYGSVDAALPGSSISFASGQLYNGESIGTAKLSSLGTAPVGTTNNLSNWTVDGFNQSNYTISYQPTSLTVTPAPLTLATSGFVKSYGSVGAILSGSALSVTAGQLFNGDSIALANASSPGTDPAGRTTMSNWTVSGSGLGNYTISYAPTALTITPASLSLAASGFSKTYGSVDASLPGSALSVTGGQLFNGDRIDSATMPSSAAASVGTSSGLGNWTASGNRLSNYTISYAPATLTITPAPLTLAAPGFVKSYGSVGAILSGSALSVTAGQLFSWDSIALATASSSATDPAGKTTLSNWTVSGNGLGNYTITTAPAALTIVPAALSLAAPASGFVKGYGSAGATLSGSALSITGGRLFNGDSIALATASSPATDPAGKTTLSNWTVSGSGLGNYTISYAPAALTITPAALSLAASGFTKTYGSVDATLSGSALSVIGGQLFPWDSIALATASSPATDPAGKTTIFNWTVSGSGLGNYRISTAAANLTINPALLSWSVADAQAFYGGQPKLGAVTLSGLVNKDVVTGRVGLFQGSSAVPTSGVLAVGVYREEVSGLAGPAAGNYRLSASGNHPGWLTVEAPVLQSFFVPPSQIWGPPPDSPSPAEQDFSVARDETPQEDGFANLQAQLSGDATADLRCQQWAKIRMPLIERLLFQAAPRACGDLDPPKWDKNALPG